MYSYVKRNLKNVTVRVAIEIIVFLASIVIFAIIVDEVVLENERQLDLTGFRIAGSVVSPIMTSIMEVITLLGSWYFLIPAWALVICWAFFIKKQNHLAWDILAIAITSTVIMFGLKYLFQRERPGDPLLHAVPGFSFPSGHSSSSFIFFGVLIYIVADLRMSRGVKWGLSIFFFLLASLIAFSRVYLRVHYPSDVLAGFCLAIIWLGLSFWILHLIRGKRHIGGRRITA